MRASVSTIGAAVICFIFCGVSGSALPKDLPPSPLEAFAARPTATVVWSKLIGHLESRETRATVTTLIIEDAAAPPGTMRGLRIDLAHRLDNPRCEWKYEAWRIMCQRANAAVYIEESRLPAVRNGIQRSGTAQLRPMEFISQYRTNAGGHESTGLIVCGYRFADVQPGELAALLTLAIDELKVASR